MQTPRDALRPGESCGINKAVHSTAVYHELELFDSAAVRGIALHSRVELAAGRNAGGGAIVHSDSDCAKAHDKSAADDRPHRSTDGFS